MTNELCRKHYAEGIADITASKTRWSAVNELLHTNDRTAPLPPKEAKLQCYTVSAFFSNTVCRMKQTITSRLTGLIHNPFAFDDMRSRPQTADFTPVTTDEEMKLLNTLPDESSSMDL